MGEFAGRYVVRYGWTRAGLTWFAITTLFVGVCFLPHVEPPGGDHIELVVSPFALWIAMASSSRRKTFQVDKQGITLYRRMAFRRPRFVPWDDVVAVDWSTERRAWWGRTTRLRVLRRRAPRPGEDDAVAVRPEEAEILLVGQADPGYLAPFPSTTTVERDTTLSRVDPAFLAKALDLLAPGVRHFGDLGDLALSRADIRAASRELNR